MSYSSGLTTAQANRDLGWTKARRRAYWDARAKACQEFSDEGECLAQVAKHVPVTIGGLGGGLGVDTTAADIQAVLNVTAGLLRDPEGTLRARGPAIVAAADRHIVEPMVQEVGKAMAPYAVKYLLPPLAVLYVLSGISAYYSYHAAKRLRPNRRRRSRH